MSAPWFAAPYRSPYRNADAEMDARIEDWTLREIGVIEDDEPTEWSHHTYMRAFHESASGEFTREERATIRATLGLGPFGTANSQPGEPT